ncbi:MAG: hypothetical protein K9L66_06260 [Spirochaetaceae bacterium]|nr:hypothetical protein [Spirochaetaceae bacterium]
MKSATRTPFTGGWGAEALCVLLCLFLFAVPLAAEPALAAADIDPAELPVRDLSSAEQQQLSDAQMLMHVLDSHRQLRISDKAGTSETAAEIRRTYERLDPNFLAEAMFVLPVPPGTEQEVLQQVKSFLQQVEQFEDIPYYSEHNGTWNPLFENIQIQELPMYKSSPSGESEGIITTQKMRPFKPYTAVYRYDLSKGQLLYRTYNQSALHYKWMRAVRQEQMQTTLLVEAHEGYLFFYGLGGARAFDFFGLFGDRLDVAFTGRIEAFFDWFHQEFAQPRLSAPKETPKESPKE